MSFGLGSSNDQKQSNNLLNYNAQAATPASQAAQASGTAAQASGNDALKTGMGYLNSFSNNLSAPTNYFQSLLSGNKAQSTAALAPDISRISDQTQGALQSTSTLAPRGGGRSSTLFNLPFQAGSQVSGLYNGQRAGAAQGLTNIAGAEGQVGLGEGGLGANLLNTGVGYDNAGANFLNAGTTAANDFGNQSSTQRQQNAAASSALGSGIMSLLTGGASNIFTGVGQLGKQLGGVFGG